jgi:hypothetical protein
VPLQLPDLPEGTRLLDQQSDAIVPLDDTGKVELAVEGYGHHWFRVSQPGDRRLA